MLSYIYPKINRSELVFILQSALLGALISGCYGALHDQITFSISAEYFTHFKFKKFHYVDFGLGDRIFVACIGFQATWWVGFFAGWFLARKAVTYANVAQRLGAVIKGFVVIFISGALAAVVVGIYGLFNHNNFDLNIWAATFTKYEIINKTAFLRVAYIHYASYAGATAGLLVAILGGKFYLKEPIAPVKAG